MAGMVHDKSDFKSGDSKKSSFLAWPSNLLGGAIDILDWRIVCLPVGVVDCYALAVDGVDSVESKPHHPVYAAYILLADA